MRVWEIPGAKYDSLEKHIAILPIGSLERHGDHLPLGTDTIEAQYIAEKISEKLNAHLFPPIWYGSTRSMRGFLGSIDVDPDAFYFYTKSVLKEISRNGYKYIVVINGHGGNSYLIRSASREVAYETSSVIIVIDWWRDLAQEDRYRIFKYPGHAGEDETSVMLYIAPQMVDMSRARKHVERVFEITVFSRDYDKKLYPEAFLGDAASGDPEKGRLWLEKIINEGVRKILEIISYFER